MAQQSRQHSQPVERQHVPMSWVLIVAAFWSTFVIAVMAYLPLWVAALAALITGVPLAVWLYLWGHTSIRVGPEGVRVGRALLEWEYAETPIPLDRAKTRNRLGPGASVQAWLATKPWLPEAVELPVRDPADPHPYWLIGSRDATALASVIVARRPDAGPVLSTAEPDDRIAGGPVTDDSSAIG